MSHPSSRPEVGPAALWGLEAGGAVLFAWALAHGVAGLAATGAVPWSGLAGLALAGALRGAAAAGAMALGARQARTVKSRAREQALGVLFSLRRGQARSLGEAGSAAVDEVEALEGQVARYRPLRLAAMASPLLVLACAALASPVAAGILLLAMIPFGLVLALAGGAAADAARRQFDALARLTSLFVDRVRALPVILAFEAQGREADRLAAASREAAERTLSVLRIAFISSAGLEFFAALSVALTAAYAGFSLLGLLPFRAPETLNLERALFVLALAPEVYLPMRRLAAAYHDRQLGDAARGRLAELDGLQRVPAPGPARLTAAPEVRFAGATVRWAGDARVVGPLDFAAAPGQIVALMGPTGCGKSTALGLLLGLTTLAEGDIRVDGVSLKDAGPFAADIAWAGQATALFPGTLGDNIGAARPGAATAEIAQAAIRAGLGTLLAARPEGLDTVLDERGSGLSGGERRRIGLARALLKDARLLLLDEPTADLDAAAEDEMISAIREGAQGRTVLIATHSERLAALAGQVVRL